LTAPLCENNFHYVTSLQQQDRSGDSSAGVRDLMRQTVSDLLSGFGDDYWAMIDREKQFPAEFERAAIAVGLMGTTLPEEYGGVGLGVTEAALVLRQVANSPAGLDGCSVVHMGMFGLNPVKLHGSAAQRQQYLPLAAKGEMPNCFMVTEPDAGTDTTRITTFARRDGDDYIISGRKVWISRAQEAKIGLLLCRTTPYADVTKKTDGMSLLLLPMDSPGIELRRIEKMGRHGVDSNEVYLDNVRVPATALVGPEGKGFYCLLDGLNPERIMIAAEAIGLGLEAVGRAVGYARDRHVFGRPIGSNQGVQLPLADVYSQLKAAELLMLHAAELYDNGRPCGAEANMAKLRGTEAMHLAINVAFETFGGYGFAKEFAIERFYRQAPLVRVAPVTNNLTKAYIATHVLGLPKSY
jgi:acyl-CoA dehydrogenase